MNGLSFRQVHERFVISRNCPTSSFLHEAMPHSCEAFAWGLDILRTRVSIARPFDTFNRGQGARDQARRVVSSRQLRPRSTASRETSVKAITPTAAKVSPRWLQ